MRVFGERYPEAIVAVHAYIVKTRAGEIQVGADPKRGIVGAVARHIGCRDTKRREIKIIGELTGGTSVRKINHCGVQTVPREGRLAAGCDVGDAVGEINLVGSMQSFELLVSPVVA